MTARKFSTPSKAKVSRVGAPAVFIRASRCNLHCVWCDTDHTWNFEGTPWPHEKDAVPGYAKFRKADVTFEITPADAAERILAFDCPRTVITGGEPLLQEKAFLEMIGHIRDEPAGAPIRGGNQCHPHPLRSLSTTR